LKPLASLASSSRSPDLALCEAISVQVYSTSVCKNIPRGVADATRVNEKLTEARTSGLEKRQTDKVKKRREEKKRKEKERDCAVGTTELPQLKTLP
jgi:hypothetical protein